MSVEVIREKLPLNCAPLLGNVKHNEESHQSRKRFENALTIGDAAEAFRSYLGSHGVLTDADFRSDGFLHRFHIEGHSRGTKNGAYVLHSDRNQVGWFMDHKSGIRGIWRPSGRKYKPTRCESERVLAERILFLKDQHKRYLFNSSYARHIYEGGTQVSRHDYLTSKGIPACRHLRMTWDGTLLVPVFDLDGHLWSIQRIFRNAEGRYEKRFLSGCRTSGCSFRINGDEVFGICEGISTGISIRKQTGHTIFCAFSASNLMKVGKGIRERNPDARIIFYADNDKSAGNPGVTFATEAAKAVRADLCIPPIIGADWNDILSGGVC